MNSNLSDNDASIESEVQNNHENVLDNNSRITVTQSNNRESAVEVDPPQIVSTETTHGVFENDAVLSAAQCVEAQISFPNAASNASLTVEELETSGPGVEVGAAQPRSTETGVGVFEKASVLSAGQCVQAEINFADSICQKALNVQELETLARAVEVDGTQPRSTEGQVSCPDTTSNTSLTVEELETSAPAVEVRATEPMSTESGVGACGKGSALSGVQCYEAEINFADSVCRKSLNVEQLETSWLSVEVGATEAISTETGVGVCENGSVTSAVQCDEGLTSFFRGATEGLETSGPSVKVGAREPMATEAGVAVFEKSSVTSAVQCDESKTSFFDAATEGLESSEPVVKGHATQPMSTEVVVGVVEGNAVPSGVQFHKAQIDLADSICRKSLHAELLETSGPAVEVAATEPRPTEGQVSGPDATSKKSFSMEELKTSESAVEVGAAESMSTEAGVGVFETGSVLSAVQCDEGRTNFCDAATEGLETAGRAVEVGATEDMSTEISAGVLETGSVLSGVRCDEGRTNFCDAATEGLETAGRAVEVGATEATSTEISVGVLETGSVLSGVRCDEGLTSSFHGATEELETAEPSVNVGVTEPVPTEAGVGVCEKGSVPSGVRCDEGRTNFCDAATEGLETWGRAVEVGATEPMSTEIGVELFVADAVLSTVQCGEVEVRCCDAASNKSLTVEEFETSITAVEVGPTQPGSTESDVGVSENDSVVSAANVVGDQVWQGARSLIHADSSCDNDMFGDADDLFVDDDCVPVSVPASSDDYSSDTPCTPLPEASPPSGLPVTEESEMCVDLVSSNHDRGQQETKRKKVKIPRPCFFCGKFQTNLNRHVRLQHHNFEAVKEALGLSRKERDLAFANFRKQGILNYNITQLKEKEPVYEKERQKTKSVGLVMCNTCKGFYSKTYFARHRNACMSDSAVVPQALPLKLLQNGNETVESDDFKLNVLARFSKDSVGEVCRTDKSIIFYGARMYDKITGKKDKAVEVKRSVMADMRRLAILLIAFNSKCSGKHTPVSDSKHMLRRKTFSILSDAIKEVTQTEKKEVKAGLKTAYRYLLKKFAKIIKARYLVNDNDDSDVKAGEIDKFCEVLTLNQNLLFGDAAYILNKNRQTKLRRPERLPSDDDVSMLRNYTVNRITELSNLLLTHWDKQVFIELRDCVVSRLTLFNARRGGEPARMTIEEWEEADEGVWLKKVGKERRDKESKLFRDTRLAYQCGKGNNHLVPVLITKDTFTAMRLLCDPAIRESCEVAATNEFVFPSTKQSNIHISGWHATRRVSTDAGVVEPDLLTATTMRHRVSTIYASLDIPENDRAHFYRHMGHSSNINMNIYQTPLAEAEIIKVGSHLMGMDGKNPSSQTVDTDGRASSSAIQTRTSSQRPSANKRFKMNKSTSSSSATRTSRIQTTNYMSIESTSSFAQMDDNDVEVEPDRTSSSPSSLKQLSIQLSRIQQNMSNDDNEVERATSAIQTRTSSQRPSANKRLKMNKSTSSSSATRTSRNQTTNMSIESTSSDSEAEYCSDGSLAVPSKLKRCPSKAMQHKKVEGISDNRGERRVYTKWSESDSRNVQEYFQQHIHGDSLPSRDDIMLFKSQYNIQHDYNRIYIKVFNERKLAGERQRKRAAKLGMNADLLV